MKYSTIEEPNTFRRNKLRMCQYWIDNHGSKCSLSIEGNPGWGILISPKMLFAVSFSCVNVQCVLSIRKILTIGATKKSLDINIYTSRKENDHELLFHASSVNNKARAIMKTYEPYPLLICLAKALQNTIEDTLSSYEGHGGKPLHKP